MPRKRKPAYEPKQIQPAPGRENDYLSEMTPFYENGKFFCVRDPNPKFPKLKKDFNFYVQMPDGRYANIGFQMHRQIRIQKEAKEFTDWLAQNFGDFDPSMTEDMYEAIQETQWANDFYRGSRRKDESLIRRLVRNILLEQKLMNESGYSNRQSMQGTKAENIVRVSYGIPMVQRHMPGGDSPDMIISGIGPIEVKSIEGGRVGLEITRRFQNDELPTAEDFIDLKLNGQKLWGVKGGKVYDLEGALVPQGKGKPTRDKKRLFYWYRVVGETEVTTKHGSKKDCKEIIAHIMAGNTPAETCAEFIYPAVANGPKSIDFQGDWPTMDDRGDDSGWFQTDREHYKMPAIVDQGETASDPSIEYYEEEDIKTDRVRNMKRERKRLRKEKEKKRREEAERRKRESQAIYSVPSWARGKKKKKKKTD